MSSTYRARKAARQTPSVPRADHAPTTAVVEPLETRTLMARVPSVEPVIDTSYGTGGVATYTYEGLGVVGELPGGRFAIGNWGLESEETLAVYGPDGRPDPTFGTDGILNRADSEANLGGIAGLPDGKVFLAEFATLAVATDGIDAGTDILLFTRYNSDGTPDLTFDGDGVMRIPAGDFGMPNAALARPDGAILVVVQRSRYTGSEFDSYHVTGHARISPEGTFVAGDSQASATWEAAFAVHADNSVTFGTVDLVSNTRGTLSLNRVNADGKKEFSWEHAVVKPRRYHPEITPGGPRRKYTFLSQPKVNLVAIAAQADGKVVAVAQVWDGTPREKPYMLVSRYNADGTVDTTFGKRGIYVPPLRERQTWTEPADIDVLPDGRILVTGKLHIANPPTTVTRLLPNGQPDPTFGVRGTSRLQTPSPYNGIVGLQVQDDNSFVLFDEDHSPTSTSAVRYILQEIPKTRRG